MSEPSLKIENDTDLHYRIMKLTNLKEEQELVIKRNVRELVYSMHPSMMIKNLIGKLSSGGEETSTLKSTAMNLGKDFLISRLFGKGGSVKGFLTSLLVRKATDYVMENHSDTIAKGISKVQELVKGGISKVGDYVNDKKTKAAH